MDNEKFNKLFNNIDQDGDSEIDYNEFISVYMSEYENPRTMPKLNNAFEDPIKFK